MKNLFKTQRERKNKRLPYVVEYNGLKHYLFLLTKSSSCIKILDIQRDFADEKIIFGYVDKSVEKGMQIEDAMNFFNCKGVGGASEDEIKNYEVFYFDGNNFSHSTLKRDGKHPNVHLKITNVVRTLKADIVRLNSS